MFDLPHALSLLHCMTQQLSAGIFSPYPSFWVDERMNREKGSDGPIRANMEGRESRKLLATEIVDQS